MGLNSTFLFLLISCSTAAYDQALPNLYHSENHGDPQFLSEPGWKPMLNGSSLSGWHGAPGDSNEWFTTKSVTWKRIFDPTHLSATPEPGDRIVNGRLGKTGNLISDASFGSFELYLEFMTAKGSNSGVYLGGLYEVQLFDSYGFTGAMTAGDCGGIYEREDDTGGSPPKTNASLPPGEWQSLQIWFQAPAFDQVGAKSRSARILRVILNGVPVQEDIEVPGPTRSHLNIPEGATNPIMLQGDHSAIAFRSIYVRPLAF
jgi:hypothetical protein